MTLFYVLVCSRFGDDHLLNEYQDQQDEIDFSGKLAIKKNPELPNVRN